MESGFYNMDCMEAMKQFPDKFFDLAIVDPPYGDGGQNIGGGKRFGQRFDRYKHPLPAEELSKARRNVGLRELEERGRRNTQKNCCVGRSPGAGLLR